ncbi:vitamin B12-dependent ribonucleotide reductase [Elysia marginata]|uniref:Vitamin B12-dependent ribonucleotide reductase n=1 Tax=Elysia marginata TaxID=1093978 RepID=A0AAV4FEU6_9GAST|nr:vitamin B12-dependent ribonucleotide reductase [Elysia marginata]
MRGQHSTRPNKLQEDVTLAIINHSKSFRGRKSHYTPGATRKVYLLDTLNVAKMHSFYLQSQPSESEVSYETYRNIFKTKFNIGLGYPRKDTCAQCDELGAKNHILASSTRV